MTADIYVNYGENLAGMTEELLHAAGVAARLRPSMRVCVKPNLVVARPAQDGATTHPAIVEGIVRFLHANGCENICVAEGAWVGEATGRAWRACGYEALARRYGLELVDTKKDETRRFKVEGMSLDVCESVLRADYFINAPVLKGHCQTALTCCLKNMKGCIPDGEKRRYHTMGLHKPIAALNTIIKPDLHVVDNVCGDQTFEEGGSPVDTGRILLGFDPVALDSYCAGLIGLRADEVEYVRLAERLGVGKLFGEGTSVVELNAENRPVCAPARQGRGAARYAGCVEQKGACSACYAALVCALNKRGGDGPRDKIKIGQGFRGKRTSGLGVGNCAAGCERHVEGCPPKAVDILAFLKKL